MTLAKFARMCDVLEYQTPTLKARTISNSLSGFSNKEITMKILSLEYPTNNIGSSRAVNWISNALGMFEEEVKESLHIWGDLGECVYEIDIGNEDDSNISIVQLESLLELDCGRINSNSYVLFAEALQQMSAREKKWFVRYWLKKPRNGVNNKIPLKAMKLHYKNDNLEKYYQYNTATDICAELEAGNEPECKLVHGHFVKPMLAKARKGKEKPAEYMMDIKYDGNRYQIHKEDDSVIIFNRKGKVVTNQYTDIVDIVKTFSVDDCILDTEIYPVEINGDPAPHKLLGKRVHMKDKAKAIEICPVKLAIFDFLSFGYDSLLELSLEERLEYRKHFPSEYLATICDDSKKTIQSFYNLAIDWGYEGIMIKDTALAYQPGKRSKGWLKYKPPRISLDVVITSAQYGQGKRSGVFGTFGISVRDDTNYTNVGKVGTGFSDGELTLLTNELRKLVETYVNDTYYFLPRVVLEVTSDLVTTDSDGNIGLRFPRCVRIRHDKYPADIDTMETISEMM